MHDLTRNIDKTTFIDRTVWLKDDVINMLLTHCNQLQGPLGRVLFISTLHLNKRHMRPDTIIDGRVISSCSVIVQASNQDGVHWSLAVWCQAQPHTVYGLDSKMWLKERHFDVFLSVCRQLAPAGPSPSLCLVDVAQQTDNCSCGLYVVEFCRILAAEGADITTEHTQKQLLEIDVRSTRSFLGKLYRTLGHTTMTMVRPVKRQRNKDKKEGIRVDAQVVSVISPTVTLKASSRQKRGK